MPDISKLEEAIEGLNTGVHPTLGVTIGSRKVTPGEYIPKQGRSFANRGIISDQISILMAYYRYPFVPYPDSTSEFTLRFLYSCLS